MKKIISILLIASMTLSFASCTGSNDNTSSSSQSESSMPKESSAIESSEIDLNSLSLTDFMAEAQKRNSAISEYVINSDNSISITSNMGEIYDAEKKIKNNHRVMKNILKFIQIRDDYISVSFEFFGDITDVYGAVHSNKIMTSNFTKETIDKINFDNFSFDNIPQVADEYWVHQNL